MHLARVAQPVAGLHHRPGGGFGPLGLRAGRSASSDVDLCELYDAFTYMLLVTLEDLGFCPKGAGGRFVDGNRLLTTGELPTNTDGGGLSACHPGMRGLFLIVEAVRQLRGECGDRPGRYAEVACVSGTGGWFCSSGTLILGRD